MSEWHNRYSFYGKVFTSYYELPSGWTATVTDDSATHAPFRGTKYHVAAICRHWGVSYPGSFLMLADAQAAALAFTARMPKCSGVCGDDVACREGWKVRDAVLAEWVAKENDASKA